MRKVFWLLAFLLLVHRSAQAQTFPIRVHDQPQCQWYVADSTALDPGVTCHLPLLISGQEHWGPSNRMTCDESLGLLNPCVGHTHIECLKPPIWGETTGYLVLNCRIVIFHTEGHIELVWSELGVNVLWQDTGSSVAPQMEGDPMGVRTFNFTMWFDPGIGYRNGYWECPHGWNPHGPTCVAIQARTRLFNGTGVDDFLSLPFYSVLDLTAPEYRYGPEEYLMRVQVSAQPPGELNVWGAVIVQATEPLPILGALTAPVSVAIGSQSYGQNPSAPAYTLSMRKNPDIHNGIIGTELTTGVYSPGQIGPGDKVAAIWRADSFFGSADGVFRAHESVGALLVVTMAGDAVAPPPPPICIPPQVLQGGVCVTPTPPPSPWSTLFIRSTAPTVWLGQCVDPTGTQCFPINMLAVCAGADPTNCAWTPVVVKP